MNSWEERLAAILPFTRSILAAACWKYSSFISMPIYLRPVRSAAAQVEADPQKASSTILSFWYLVGTFLFGLSGTRSLLAFPADPGSV